MNSIYMNIFLSAFVSTEYFGSAEYLTDKLL